MHWSRPLPRHRRDVDAVRTAPRGPVRRVLAALVPAVLAFTALLPAPGASATTSDAAAGSTSTTVTSDLLTTPQVDGTVYSIAVVGDVAYVGGHFTTARPAGTSAGDAAEVSRTNLMAFRVSTGEILDFAPVVTGTTYTSATAASAFCDTVGTNSYNCNSVYRVVASPDGSRVYVAGDFTRIDGTARYRVAAFSTSTGSLVTSFKPVVSSQVRALAVTDTAVYIGGAFTTVNGTAVARLARLSTSGVLDSTFAAKADRAVWAVALSDDGTRLVVGGQFDYLDGVRRRGLGAVYTADGTIAPWSSSPLPGSDGATTNRSWVTDFTVVDGSVYVAVDGEGSGVFDGRLRIATDTGDVEWIDRCLGATQSIAVLAGVVYSASHAHDCTLTNSFPQAQPQTYQRLIAETTDAAGTNSTGETVPQILDLALTTNGGPSSSYWKNGPWAVETSEESGVLIVGGEFTTVNGTSQQGLAMFTLSSSADNAVKPESFTRPEVTATTAGSVRVNWRATFDRESSQLTYEVLRDGSSTPVATFTATSRWYDLPELSWTDTGLTPGTTHTYKVRAVDGDGNTRTTSASVTVTVAATDQVDDYAAQVLADGAVNYVTFDDATGTVALDDAAGRGTVAHGTLTLGVSGAVGGRTAARFTGSSSSWASVSNTYLSSDTLSVEMWVKTTSTKGGAVLGFGQKASGSSARGDRTVYVGSNGRLYVGVYGTSARTLGTTTAVNDGAWHHVVATLGQGGLSLYVDGTLVGTDTSVTWGRATAGYWRIGGDVTSGWTSAPTSNYLAGTIDEVAVYDTVLTAQQVAAHRAAAAG